MRMSVFMYRRRSDFNNDYNFGACVDRNLVF